MVEYGFAPMFMGMGLKTTMEGDVERLTEKLKGTTVAEGRAEELLEEVVEDLP